MVVLLLANSILIESAKGLWSVRTHNFKQSRYIHRRYIHRPRSRSTYYSGQDTGAKKFDDMKWVETPPPLHRSMENPERLQFLAMNKNDRKSNIGKALSGG